MRNNIWIDAIDRCRSALCSELEINGDRGFEGTFSRRRPLLNSRYSQQLPLTNKVTITISPELQRTIRKLIVELVKHSIRSIVERLYPDVDNRC